MHRVVAKTPEGMHCDHIHHNTLDNRESELRNVTISQSQINRRVMKTNKLGIKGVIERANKTYRATLHFEGKIVFDQTYKTIEEAINARAVAEKEFFGHFNYQHDV